MRVPLRIVVPIMAALLCCLLLVGIVWWQASLTSQLIAEQRTGNTSQQTESTVSVPTLRPVAVGSDETMLAMRQGDLLALEGRWEQATESYAQAVEQGGGLPALRKLGQAQLMRSDLEGATQTLEQLKRAGATDEDTLLFSVLLALRGGELQQAKAIVENAPTSPHASYAKGLIAIASQDHEAAKGHLAQVLQGWEPVLRTNARTLLDAYDEYALFPDGNSAYLLTLLARALAQVQECHLALPLLSQVLSSEQDYRDAWMVQGYCELTIEEPMQALASLEQAYTIDPQKPEIQYFLARSYRDSGQSGNAVTFYQYALQNGFEPQQVLRRELALAALDSGNPTLALEQMDLGTASQQATVEDYLLFFQIALQNGAEEEAKWKWEQAQEKWPEDPRIAQAEGEIF